MNPPPLPEDRVTKPRLFSITLSVFLITFSGDFLFWFVTPGLSLALFVLVLTAAVMANRTSREFRRGEIFTLLLVCGAAFQAGVEISFSNILVLLVLLVVLTGEAFFGRLSPGWPRWSESLWSFVKTPVRWLLLLGEIGRQRTAENGGSSAARGIARGLRICLPAILLTFVFTTILANGNAIFGKWISGIANAFLQWLTHFDVTAGRIFFWMAVAFFALPFVQPGRLPASARWWTRAIPPLPEPAEVGVRLWQIRLMLILLNALFFSVNTIDAIYLWIHSTLPAGVTYSSFVHSGVFSLVLAVLLSALILVAVFQQADVVSREKSLRVLALLWIAQNIVLVASVLLRLKLYVDAYQLSELRIYVAFFLLLVTAGFLLLAVHVQWRRTLNWLCFTNAVAVFVLFYIVQFADVGRFVAHYNVEQWKANPSCPLDVGYLRRLGPSAWPELQAVARENNSVASTDAREKLKKVREEESNYLATLQWRSWQARHVHYARELTAGAAP